MKDKKKGRQKRGTHALMLFLCEISNRTLCSRENTDWEVELLYYIYPFPFLSQFSLYPPPFFLKKQKASFLFFLSIWLSYMDLGLVPCVPFPCIHVYMYVFCSCMCFDCGFEQARKRYRIECWHISSKDAQGDEESRTIYRVLRRNVYA